MAVLDEPLDIAAWIAEGRPSGEDGAANLFVGICRSENGRVRGLELEHYPGMAEAELTRIAADAAERFALSGALVVHRTGYVAVGEPIVMAAAKSSHRSAAFDAVRFMMDFLKTEAPFWKREVLADGRRGRWVSSKPSDEAARDDWTSAPARTPA